ncbi:hypothetical protein PGT21_002311 [Puccinia graminis f. sp. tritici]|uniref:Uncharacterized protein n=1 Tax=Puccinia graminis f. sp. tritici TaxID=56615 RepID=A0A5B0SI06_PUCGR|nr:hypothetical protein PGT21_002311 [Puccinia graminis f. sp. tritici]KAA1137185.1 hypothetical protein PGTUg99_012443 [Puccinia graminis f. sp. tritici]
MESPLDEWRRVGLVISQGSRRVARTTASPEKKLFIPMIITRVESTDRKTVDEDIRQYTQCETTTGLETGQDGVDQAVADMRGLKQLSRKALRRVV